MGFIYKITNDINDKIYIGKTEYANPEKRWKEHLSDYKKRRYKNRPLYVAMNKYGERHFHFEIIEKTNNAENREKYWIEKLCTYIGFDDCNGYNATLGGDGKPYLNLDENEVENKYYEFNKNMSNTAKFYNVDICTIKNILKNIGVRTNTSIDSIRITQGKPVYQLKKNDLTIIRKFDTIADANRFFGKDRLNGNIRTALKNIDKTAFGYKWCYSEIYWELIKTN